MKRLLSRWPIMALIAIAGSQPFTTAQVRITPYDMAQARLALTAAEKNGLNSATKLKKSHATVSDNQINILLTLEDGYPSDAITAAGMEIKGRIKNHVYGSAPINCIEKIAATAGVTQFSIARTRKLVNDMARSSCGVDDVHSGDGVLKAYNGEGVIIGITDAGLDPNHITFIDPEGKHRVKRLWHYKTSFPQCYNENDMGNFTTDDYTESHGTHVLGTAAGSCATTDKGNDYHGVAPAADIAIMCGNSDDASILDGVSKIIEFAEAEGKPLVINMSLGDNFGPHDGTDTFTAALNELAANENTTIFVAAGNEGERNIAIVSELEGNATTVRTILNSSDYTSSYYPTASSLSQGIGYIDVWSDDNRPLKVYLDIINTFSPATPIYTLELGETPKYIGQGYAWYQFLKGKPDSNETFNKYYSNGFIGGYTELSKANNRFNATMAVYLDAISSTFYSTFVSLRVEGEPGQKVYIYNDGYGLDFESRSIKGFSDATANGTISNMACGKNTISVGSFNTRGGGSAGAIGEMSSFSSFGILNDGRSLPDIAAPGSQIYSARNQHLSRNVDYYYPKVDSTNDSESGRTYYWTSMDGTSMATPFATGVGALLLSVNPYLQSEDIRYILKQSATAPTVADTKWGAGKINALEAVKLAENYANSINNVLNEPRNGITVNHCGGNIWQIYSPSEKKVDISITTLSGQTIVNIPAENEATIDLNGYSTGIYIISVKGSKSHHSEKIAVK